MHPEIEKLIEMALSDGQFSENKRDIILGKAEDLGLDLDEVEMYLEVRLNQMAASQPRSSKEKVGNIKTCPACGASVKAMEIACADCGHEFTNIEANKTTVSLATKLEESRIAYLQSGGLPHEFDQGIAPPIIREFPIPNSKEDLIEMLSFMASKVLANTNPGMPDIEAYNAKALEVITKLKFSPGIDSAMLSRVESIEAQMKEANARNANKLKYILLGFWVVFVLIAVGIIFSEW